MRWTATLMRLHAAEQVYIQSCWGPATPTCLDKTADLVGQVRLRIVLWHAGVDLADLRARSESPQP